MPGSVQNAAPANPRLIPEHHAASFEMALCLARPHHPRPSPEELVAELHFCAGRGGRMAERYAEPIHGDIDELSLDSRGASLQIQPHLASTSESRLHPVIQDRLAHAWFQERETKGAELCADHDAY